MGIKSSRPIFNQSTVRWMTTSTPKKSTAKMKREKEGTKLFRKLAALGFGNSDETTVADILNEWQSQSNPVSRPQLLSYVTQLRRFKHHRIALQLYQWMEEKERTITNADRAIYIDLLAKTEGVASAENYFNALAESSKTKKTYGALLNCYCHGQMVEKATQLFQKMTELNFHANALNYNNMMALYVKTNMPEKVPLLVREMEEKKIPLDLYSYNQLMNSYAALKDVDAAEGVLKTMRNNKVKFDWFTLGNLATIYLNAGLEDKALASLKELEKRKIPKNPDAFHTLIILYSQMSIPTELNRVWELFKSQFSKPGNVSYLIMHLALSRLGDHDGLEKLFKEWKSVCSYYDIRISNVMLESYLKRDMIGEACLLYDSVVRRGVLLNLRTHNVYIILCLKKNRIDLALKRLEECAYGITSEQTNWFPPQETVNAFSRYFKEVKDTHAAIKFKEIMKMMNRLDVEIEEGLDWESSSLFPKLIAQFSNLRVLHKRV